MEASAISEFGYSQQPQQDNSLERRVSDHFIVEDLLDFSNDDDGVVNDGSGTFEDTHNSISNSTDSSTVVTPVDSCNSSFSGINDNVLPPPGDIASHGFSGGLCVPAYDELAELEWLSNIVDEDSFSSEDLQKFHLISGMSAMKTRPDEGSETRFYNVDKPRHVNNAPSPVFNPEMPVPGKARSKRSRAAPCNWTSRLMVLSPAANGSPNPVQPMQSGPDPNIVIKPAKPAPKKKGGSGSGSDLPNGEVRKCLHCATDKTPQWRSGPLGPKTLCNACGVRYKSGRLVPEYRPASSPTFVLSKHSNSHRKVMELRRQKEVMKQQQVHQQQQYQQQLIHRNASMMFESPDDYFIHQHIGSDFRQLI